MSIIKNIINKFKVNYPWEKYYKKNERNIDVPNMSVYEYLVKCAEYNMNSVAINYFNNKLTYKQFFEQVDLCARAFKSQGIRENDVITVCMANTPEAIISIYAINKIGAIANLLHPLSAEQEIKKSVIATNSVMLVAIDLAYSKIKNIIHDTNVYKTVIVSPSNSMPTMISIGYKLLKCRKIEKPKNTEDFMYWNSFIIRGKMYKGSVLIKRKSDDEAFILHSGGTSGTPKSIVLINANINSIIEQAKIIFPKIGVNDKFLSVLPLFHCFGLVVCVHAPLCFGATCILIPQFDAKRFDKLLTKYKPTVLAGVPTLYEAMITNKHMEKVNLSKVKYVISGGDSLSISKNKQVNDFLYKHNCQVTVMQGYGMTESTGPFSIGGCGSNKLGSVGIPLPGNMLEIVEPNTGIKLKKGEIGEICLCGPGIMKGYLNNNDATNEIMKKHDDEKLWIHTGDLGYIDKDGVLFYVQRLKRMLIVSGYNVYPSYVESVINECPEVENCGVIGIPHPYKVQVPKAYIVLKDGIEDDLLTKRKIKEYCIKNLSSYMVPKEFEFRKSLPKTMIGKIDYKLLEKK